MPTGSRVVLSTLLLFAVLALSTGPVHAESSRLSEEALSLIPAEAVVVLVYSSLDEIDRDLLDPLREVADEDDVDEIQVMELLPDDIQTLEDVIDPARPIAMIFSLGMQYGPPEPILTVLVPVLEGADPQTMAMVSGLASAEALGGYVALSADPNYRAAGAVPALAKDLPAGQIVGRADLETAFALLQPMVDMMLMNMEQAAQQDPDADSLPQPMIQAIRGLFDSARTLELALHEKDEHLELLFGLDIFAGSVLDVGPQPPLDDALQLAGYLPDWGELLTVYAMDMSLLYENLPFLRDPSMMQLTERVVEPQTEAAMTWMQVADELSQPLERASVATARLQESGIEYVQVAALDGAREHMQKIAAHLESLPEAQLGVILTQQASETRGDLSYLRYEWEFDSEQLMNMVGEDDEEEMPDAEEMSEFAEFMEVFAPPLHMASLENRTLIVLMDEGPELDALLERFTGKPQMPPMALEGLRNWADGDFEMLAQAELRSLLQQVGEIVTRLDPEESFEIPDGEPVRIRYAVEAGELRHSALLQTRTGSVLQFIQEIDEMEDDDEESSENHEDSSAEGGEDE